MRADWCLCDRRGEERLVVVMPNVKHVSALKNYDDVIRDVSMKNPVFLTVDENENYVLIDAKDYERMQATISLFSELSKGVKSAKESGWVSMEEAEAALGIDSHE